MKLTLKAQHPPFLFSTVVGSHGWLQLLPFSANEERDQLSYIDQLSSGKVVELHMREAPGGVDIEPNIQASSDEAVEIREKVSWMFGLEQDFSEFYAHASQEPKLAHVKTKAQGRVLRSPTLFEDTVKTILTTNTAWGGTKRMVRELVDGFGTAMESENQLHAFPSPERLAALDLEALNAKVRLGYRAPYILELARAVCSGELDLEGLKSSQLPTLELRKFLLGIKGIGSYAAANLLMILGRYDFLPIDSWALKLVSHEWHAGEPVGPAEVDTAFQSWGKWKGLAYWFWDWSYQG